MRVRKSKYLTRRYLFRLLFTITLCLVIPSVVTLLYSTESAYSKLKEETRDYYQKTIEDYADYFTNELSSILNSSYEIGIESRNPDAPAYSLRKEFLDDNPYFYSEAISAINFYRLSVGSSLIGIYYPDTDRMITFSYKYNADTFVRGSLRISQIDAVDRLTQFLNADGTDRFHMISTYMQQEETGFLLISVPIQIGYSNTLAKLIFRIDGTSQELTFLESARSLGLQFLVFSGRTGEVLLSGGSKNVDLISMPLIQPDEVILSGQTEDLVIDGETYKCFFSYSEMCDCYFALMGSFEEVHNLALEYYKSMKSVMLCLVLLLCVLLAACSAIIYKPVYLLNQKVGHHSDNGEFHNISRAFDVMTDELNEMNFVLKDYLLKNILDGKSINGHLLDRLGIKQHAGISC